MRSRLYNHIKSLFLPCVFFSVAAGFFSAILITAFKLATDGIIHLSALLYGTVRENPIYLPLLILGAASIGLISSFILSKSHSCRGGGIPTSVAAIRGIVGFKWIASIFILPFSALLSFLCGLPLGTEGPCVQMGTAIGDGVVKCLNKEKHKPWHRYIMTGGASAGFSIATSSPITAILFSMEELHKHFSPMLITVASISVISAQITTQFLALLGIGTVNLFHIPIIDAIDIKILFAPLLVGIVCGGASIIFTVFYKYVDKFTHAILGKISIKIAFPIIFAGVSIIGFFLPDAIGSGHALIDKLLQRQGVWLFLIAVFLIRAIGMMISNTAGATGGVFLPTLAFGAILGSICADIMIALGWISAEHYTLIVILGITAFLSSTSRIPITACVFAIEALGGINNILAIIIAATASLLIVELSGLEDFTDTLINAKVRAIKKGNTPTVVEVRLTVKESSFAVGKEIHDILWPNACTVISFERSAQNKGNIGISAGDIITVHYKTYNPAVTAEEITSLVGIQNDNIFAITNPSDQ